MRIRFQQLAACWLLSAAGVIAAASQPPADTRPIEAAAAIAIDVAHPAPADDPVIAESARRSLARYIAWLGDFPQDRLTITRVPWLTARRDASLDRAIDAAVARQYVASLDVAANHSWFADGLAAYLATRAADEPIEVRPYLTLRFFSGYVPHAVRLNMTAPVQPQPRISEIGGDDRARRFSIALHTLERFVGWPALQSALSAFMQENRGANEPLDTLTTIVSTQRGVDMSWFFQQALRVDAQFDYAVASLATTPASGGWQTTVDVRRIGEAAFAGTSQPRDTVTARSLPVLIRFADGSEMHEWIDGRDREWRFEYASAAPATLASVDPNAILLLDADRTNNTRTVNAPRHEAGLRLAFNWLSWLQDAMLSCTAVI